MERYKKINFGGDENQAKYYSRAKFATTPIKNIGMEKKIQEKIVSLPENRAEAIKELQNAVERIELNIEDFKVAFEVLKEVLEDRRLKPKNERTEKEEEEIEKIMLHGKWILGQLKLLPKAVTELENALKALQKPILSEN